METVKVYLVGNKGAVAANSYELMTNDMTVVMSFMESNVGSEFKAIEVKGSK
jgi:hypothetical protein|tara:strand:- start:689 stop:844 length:156 start_codon:yes stop_codon:yes gene_type:complete